jgi:hypothetical protein
MQSMFSELTDGDIIRQIKAIRRWRKTNPRAFPRFSGEMLLLRIEAERRAIDFENESPSMARSSSPLPKFVV